MEIALLLVTVTVECQRVPIIQRLPGDDVVRRYEDVAAPLCTSVFLVSHLYPDGGGRMANWNSENFVPDRVQVVQARRPGGL